MLGQVRLCKVRILQVKSGCQVMTGYFKLRKVRSG
jgi:hypothetical protein